MRSSRRHLTLGANASKLRHAASVDVTTYMCRGPTNRFRAVRAALLTPGLFYGVKTVVLSIKRSLRMMLTFAEQMGGGGRTCWL